jgi:phosphatidylglycerol lysyltransferase
VATGVSNKSKSFSPYAYWREVIAVLMLLLAIVFFRSERKELQAITPQIASANSLWLFIGLTLTLVYFYLQGEMYRKSFSSVGLNLQLGSAIILFLKRNFISVFLPAGGVTSLTYSPSQVRKAGFHKAQVHQASAIFGFIGLLTVFIVGLPVIIFSVFETSQFKNAWIGLVVLLLMITLLFAVVRLIKQKGKIYKWAEEKFPSVTSLLDEVFAGNVNAKQFTYATLFSLAIELCGILHIYIAMLALGLPASLGASASVYIIAVLLMVISPFLRGLGAVEFSMVYVLGKFGYSATHALSITILYRVFEFWLPLVAGLLAYAWKGRKLFFRIAPALLTFLLGIVNIISVVTPPIHQRLRLLTEYLPLTAVHASNMMVFFFGLSLLVTAAFLIRGLRNAWIIALTLSALSLVGHLTKALDYEEAIVSAVTIITLIATASQYRIRSSNKWMQAGFKISVISFVSVLIFGCISFYFIDKKHFGIDFTFEQSLLHTLNSFLLVEDSSLHPVTRFGLEFIWLLRMLGFVTYGFLLFTFVKPNFKKHVVQRSYKAKAKFLLSQFGNSSTDYFKLYKDKLCFFSDIHEAFIAYRIAGGFAIVLEEPVCAEENKIEVLKEFDLHCRKMGLKTAFYRVDESSIAWFNQLKKSKLMIGQEAILELNKFSLEGRDKKSLRNGLNNLQKKGYTVIIHSAPHSDLFLKQLKNISDQWLENFQREELIFSQGMFDEKELRDQDIIALTNAEGNVEAFLNIIPDYAEDECTYDLIRKTNDAPGAAMDALIIKFIEYAKEKQKLFINLGMAPMTGITQPDNTAEQIIKLATAKFRRFKHYHGLREFKEKYATVWENKYLVYDNDFDLFQLPLAISKVMKP